MVALAQVEHKARPMTSLAIAEERHIPEKYLVHIMLQLKRAGLVRSVRGAQGGYLLSRPAAEITLFHVVEAIDGSILDSSPVGDAQSADMRPTWEEVSKGIEAVLKERSIRDIADKIATSDMYYI